MKKTLPFIAILVAAFALLPDVAAAAQNVAAAAPDNVLDEVVELFRTKSAGWETGLREFATGLFWLLVAIELAWTGVTLALSGKSGEEWITQLTTQLLYIGLFYNLLIHSADWSNAIVQSFTGAAAAVTGDTAGLTPSNVVDTGLDIALSIWTEISVRALVNGLAMLVAGFIVLYCFALIAATVIMTLVESYLVMSMGVLFMGFGGARWTQDFARKFFIYALGIGAKLFALHLLVAIGVDIVKTIADGSEQTVAWAGVLIVCALVLVTLTVSLPDMIQQMLTGTSSSSGRALLSAATSAAAATIAATKLASLAGKEGAGGVGAAMQAAKMAGGQTSPDAPLSQKLSAAIGGTAANLARGALSVAGAGLAKKSLGGAMREHLKTEEAGLTAAGATGPDDVPGISPSGAGNGT